LARKRLDSRVRMEILEIEVRHFEKKLDGWIGKELPADVPEMNSVRDDFLELRKKEAAYQGEINLLELNELLLRYFKIGFYILSGLGLATTVLGTALWHAGVQNLQDRLLAKQAKES